MKNRLKAILAASLLVLAPGVALAQDDAGVAVLDQLHVTRSMTASCTAGSRCASPPRC